MQRRFFKDELETEEKEQTEERPKTFSKGEKTGMLIAAGTLLYGLFANDLPVVFFTASFLSFMGRSLAETAGGAKGAALSNFLKGLGIALLLGAFFLLFV